jgi:hypothetical protein
MKTKLAIAGGFALAILAAGIWWFLHRDLSQKEAVRGLSVVRELVTKENLGRYGFKSLDELSRLQLGRGVDVFFVFKGDLRGFGRENGTPLTKVVKVSESRIYPIEVDGEGRLLMTLRKRGGVWKLASFGDLDVARNLAALERNHKVLIAIQIPGRHLSFGSFGTPSEKDDLILTPLNGSDAMVQGFGPLGPKHIDFFHKNSKFTAEEHGTISAREVFSVLAESSSPDDDAP